MKAIAAFQHKLKICWVYAYIRAYSVVRISFCSGNKVAAVNKAEAVNIPVLFIGIFIAQRNKRVMKRAAAAVAAAW